LLTHLIHTCTHPITHISPHSHSPEPMTSVHSSWFAPLDEMELTQIHRPTLIGLEASNRPPVQISARATPTTTYGSQPAPYDAKTVHPRAARRHYAAARRPRVATDLLAAYKYPLTLHYKYGMWSSVEKCPHSIPSSPSFSKLSSLA